jgi:hypothetical protein
MSERMSELKRFSYQIVIEGELTAMSKEIAQATIATQISATLNMSASFGNVSVFVEPVGLIQPPSVLDAAAEIRRRGSG